MSTSVAGLPVDAETCFSDRKGQHKKGLEKRQTKLLGKLAAALSPLLEPGERVLLAVPACSPAGVIEQLTTGWIIYYLKRCVLVLTDRRILQVLTRPNLTPRNSAAEIRYGDVAEAKVGFLGRNLTLRYHDRHKDVFTHLDSTAAKKVKVLLPTLVGGTGSRGQGARQHLCPRCATRLPADTYRCPNCFLEFKTPEAALKYSLLFPGGGYFYTGHPLLGIGDAIVETFLLVALVIGVVAVWSGPVAEDDVVTLAVIAVVLVFEKLVSVLHARHYVKEYLPVEREIRPLDGGGQPRDG
jgi:hypothetical protein